MCLFLRELYPVWWPGEELCQYPTTKNKINKYQMNECSEIESILCNTTLNNIDHYDRDYRMIHNPPVLAGDHVTKDVCTQRL